MNMISLQDHREDRAQPHNAIDLGELELGETVSTAVVSPARGSHRKSSLERMAWFRNLPLRRKVNTIFGIFFGIGFAMSIVLGLGLSELWLRYNASERMNVAVYEAVELRSVAGDLRYNSMLYLFVGEDNILDRQRKGYEAAQIRLNTIEDIAAESLPDFVPAVRRTESDLRAYNDAFTAVTTAQSQGASEERVTTLARRLASRGESLIGQTRELADNLAFYRESSHRSGATYFGYMITILIALAAFATAILFMGLRYLSYDFSAKIEEVTHGMTRLTKGDREFAIEGYDRNDEIGEMLRALNQFKRANQQLEVWARERTERAEESIQMQQERDRERAEADERKSKLLSEVAWQFEQTVGEVVEKVAAASGELGTTATAMAATADQASERTNELAQFVEEANIGATAAAAASDEFALSIAEISRQAASSSELARLANDATVKTDTTISALSQSADKVGEIVELIRTIAQRTNLLALNASIEAARGGETGRGFAVVASEVKELAMQTSRATDQVAEQIREMQNSTGDSVAALRGIAVQVSELDTTATAIASAVDQQAVAGQDLARNIDMAAHGTERVAGNIRDVRELSHSTGNAAKQVLSNADQLETQAQTLSKQVKTFLNRVRNA